MAITNIKNISGDVTIDETQSAINVKTVDGDITVGNIKNDSDEFVSCGVNARIVLETTGQGSISAYINSFEYSEDIASSITTANGKINVRLIKNMNRNISAITTASLAYLGVNIESKTGVWEVNTAKALTINSQANITIVNK